MADAVAVSGRFGKVRRYAVASVGPIGSAGAQFVLSLSLLRLLPAAEFGSFSFLLVAANFSWGLWSALFCAPLPILLNEGGEGERAIVARSLFSTNLLVAAGAGAVFGMICLALRVDPVAAAIFAVYAATALLRWFARAYGYATGTPLRTMASDIAYSATLVVGVGVMLALHRGSLRDAFLLMLASAALGLVPFGAAYLKAQFAGFSARAIPHYAAIWKRFSGWSLLGVLTTEATANCHAYIVTAAFGPGAFAPIAASALTIRPTSVAMNALTEFERAQMARQIARRQYDEAHASVRHFRIALALAWLATAVLVFVLTICRPGLIFPPEYDLRFLQIGAALWMAVAAVRMMRTPESAMLQAGGAFRPLALASVISSGVSVIAVVLLLMTAGTLWSITGILAGEAIYALWIWRQARRWLGTERTRSEMVTQ